MQGRQFCILERLWLSEGRKGDKIPLSCTEDEKGTEMMDTFIDKLAQKRNAQEIIKANMTAEAERMEQLKSQMKSYDELMQEIRKVNLKTAENVSEVRSVLKECMEKLDGMQADDAQETGQEGVLAEIKSLLEQKFQQADDFIHKENVRVYRNVQAALVEELNKQTEELKNSQPKSSNNRALLPISIFILLGVIADVVLQILSLLNFKFF